VLLRKGFAKKEVFGWLYQMLKIYNPEIKINLTMAIGIAALATWWIHGVLWLIGEPDNVEAVQIVVFFGIPILILTRVLVYLNPGYRAPMSFWGRLFTLRWIIPRYHIVYAAPVCMVAALVLMLMFGHLLGLSYIHRCELLVFVELFMAMSLPPRRVDWWLTGAHRMVEKPKRMQKQSKIAVPVGPKGTWSLWG